MRLRQFVLVAAIVAAMLAPGHAGSIVRSDAVAGVMEGRDADASDAAALVLRLRDAGLVAPGVRIAVLGRGPKLVIANTGGSVVRVLDAAGAVYAQLDAQGVKVDASSQLWATQGRGDLDAVTAGPGGLTLLDEGADHAWLDPRTEPPAGAVTEEVRADDRETVLSRWEIEIEVDGTVVEARGETVWVPVAAQRAGERVQRRFPSEYVVAVAVAGLLALLLLLRRRRGRSDSGTSTSIM